MLPVRKFKVVSELIVGNRSIEPNWLDAPRITREPPVQAFRFNLSRASCWINNSLSKSLLAFLGLSFVALSSCNPDKPSAVNATATPWLTDITQESGLDFVHENGARGQLLFPEIMIGGVALFDANQDGALDIYLTNGHRRFPENELGTNSSNKLYVQLPNGKFQDYTSESGLGDLGYGTGVAIGDIDNDGDPDLFVSNVGPDRLYRNRGDGTFEEISETAGLVIDGWSTSACFFDYNRDGFLDLYVVRYVDWSPGKKCFAPDGRRTYCGPKGFTPIHDVLLRNNGDSTFTDVSEQAGMTTIASAGLGVVCQDLNGDQYPDVYVANDQAANHLWINQGDGTFQEDALLLGVAYNINGIPEAGMGVLAADLDNDLDTDLFMTHLAQETNTFYRNLGAAIGFIDGTGEAGLSWSGIPYTGFGTVAVDIELDGDLDLLLVNGRVLLGEPLYASNLPAPWNVFAEPNLMYLNDSTGQFKPIGRPGTSFCDRVEISRGLAMGDLDGDGDVDFVVSNLQGSARIYRNDAPRKGSWLVVRAVDPRWQRDAIGARITLFCGQRQFVRTITRAYSFQSSHDPRAHFGLGKATRVDRIEVLWPDGLKENFAATPANQTIELHRGSGTIHE